CLLRFPSKGGPPARVQRAPTMNVDLMPTILEWAGMPVPAGVQGVSLLGEGPSVGRALHTLGISPVEAAWTGRYGLILHGKNGYGRTMRRSDTAEVYDLAADPGESLDLAGRRPALTERLRVEVAARQSADGHVLAVLRKAERESHKQISEEE